MSNSGQKNLFNWVKRNTGGYPGVWVEDFSRSFRDGLAFCALVHTYKNSLIPFKELKADTEEDQLKNHRLAFTAAEKEWGVTQLLDPEDMLLGNEPDKLSVMTYLAEMYKNMKTEIAQGNPYEGDYLDQLSERLKQKKLEEKGGNNTNSNTSTPNMRKPVHVSKMHKDSTVDVSNIKGCGQCQKTGNYPMCPGFNPEPFRKTRCSQCFHSDEEHLGFISDEEREEMEREKREKEEELQRLVERAKRRREAKENKKKKLREEKLNDKLKERSSLLERELKRRQEEYQNKLDERKSLQRQRQKAEDERQEKFMEARRSKRVKQREYDRNASSLGEEERKKLEEELNELTRIEEETKEPYVYDEFEPIEEPPSDISQITLEDDEEIEIDSDEIELSDEELQDPSLDDVPIPLEVKPQPVKQPIKKVPLKKMAPKKTPVKKDVKKEVETSSPPKRESTTTRREPSPKREPVYNSSSTSSSSTDISVEDNGERSERRFKRYQRRQKILDDNQIVESIRSLVSRIGSF